MGPYCTVFCAYEPGRHGLFLIGSCLSSFRKLGVLYLLQSILLQILLHIYCVVGNVVRVDIAEDQDKKSKGFGTVVFETPGEALSAVCILSQTHSTLLESVLFAISSQSTLQ